MNRILTTSVAAAALIGIFASAAASEEPTPGYNTKIPEGLLSPDKYPTRVGDIEFFDGIPTAVTAEAL